MICKVPKTVSFSLSEEQKAHIKHVAETIYACPVKSRGRDYDTVYKSTRNGFILEYALVEQGAIKNDAEFDHTKVNSYCWDVLWDGKRAEVKCFYFDDTMSWVSFPLKFVQTFINTTKRNKNLVDIIIFGHYNETSDGVITAKWRLITPSDTFADKIRKCNPKYESSYGLDGDLKYFYSHPSESRSIFIK